jgi:hypothetical protein
MNPRIEKINLAIAPLKEQIINHKLYGQINCLEDVHVFMQFHVYAVWDFMSLLKSLQNGLTCTSIPWVPVGSADSRFLINEIVVGEESDVDMQGNRTSHFELYLSGMEQCEANTLPINNFLQKLKFTGSLDLALNQSVIPTEAFDFINFTFNTIHRGKLHEQAAVFTFGREDLIPGMFHSLVSDLHKKFPEKIDTFKYYLDRHIEVDGDHHSILAMQMVENLCGDDEQKWEEAELASIASLQQRIKLWDGVLASLAQG